MTGHSANVNSSAGNIRKAGSTQPMPGGSTPPSRQPGSTKPVGRDTPTIVKAGPTQK